MASSHPTTTSTSTVFHHPPIYGSDPNTANTTFVQADASSFRAVVQKLTGASDDPSSPRLPITLPSRLGATTDVGPKKPAFKLHERRHSARKMDLSIGVSQRPVFTVTSPGPSPSSSPYSSLSPSWYARTRGSATVIASPVSPLEMLEERAIAEKGFFLHPSPLSTPRASQPELLPLFPLHSPSHNNEPTKS
ncbi:VQ motif-containing protein 11-like [Neltuma alba]|uniref:VQ motif-containing protein 11-like n=1 Tax=Neltuma alba TaxID=207710 RepID=UPI0010A58D2A|nr:VQ motif-containing protein 11-like [Prosopis alba]XP_028766401.1 VQ motif-containing protein 11-like [Prosopis alba]XP_028776421.1 VQ motif-containing protein 11-like [Prosopis alba]